MAKQQEYYSFDEIIKLEEEKEKQTATQVADRVAKYLTTIINDTDRTIKQLRAVRGDLIDLRSELEYLTYYFDDMEEY